MTRQPDSAERCDRSLTFDEMRVIRERHFGWEQAKPGLLANVFGVSVQKITAVLKRES